MWYADEGVQEEDNYSEISCPFGSAGSVVRDFHLNNREFHASSVDTVECIVSVLFRARYP